MHAAACYNDFIATKLECRLPWGRETGLEHWDLCQTEEQYNVLTSLASSLSDSDESDLQTLTGCKPTCAHLSYSLNQIVETVNVLTVPEDLKAYMCTSLCKPCSLPQNRPPSI